MVDAQCSRIAHIGGKQSAKRRVSQSRKHPGIPRRQAPRLALPVKHVRRSAHAYTLRKKHLFAPCFSAVLGRTDGKIAIQADRHAGRTRRLRRDFQLYRGYPLQIHLKCNVLSGIATKLRHPGS